MPNHICETCGAEYPDTPEPPEACVICEEERQYVGFDGQAWTTLDALSKTHRNRIQQEEAGLHSIVTEPKFAIGQRAFLIQTESGNILWDCISLLDDETVEAIVDLGGIKAIAVSHPHYYTTMATWSHTFGNAPVFVHTADRRWVTRMYPRIRFWHGERITIGDGLTLVRCGGHFEGGTALHWPAGCGGRGALLSGDIIQVVPDRRWVSFMYSYPNYIPLNGSAVRRIVAAVEPFPFERIYGAFPHMTVAADGLGAVRRSAERYLLAIAESD